MSAWGHGGFRITITCGFYPPKATLDDGECMSAHAAPVRFSRRPGAANVGSENRL
jgi:hypothetical protein